MDHSSDRIKLSRRAFEVDAKTTIDYIRDSAENFTFEKARGLRVQFGKASVLQGEVSDIKEFIQKGIKY